jgi:hypothetical protein
MTSVRPYAAKGLALLGLAGVVTLLRATPASAGNGNSSVEITNPPNAPVPVAVQGTTQVAGTVSVASPPAPQIVQVGTSLSCNPNCTLNTIYTVPANKRLVIEYVSFNGQGDDTPMSILFLVQGAGMGAFVTVPLIHYPGFTGFGSWNGSQTVKFYADANTDVQAELYASGQLDAGNLTISGYLVDTP